MFYSKYLLLNFYQFNSAILYIYITYIIKSGCNEILTKNEKKNIFRRETQF